MFVFYKNVFEVFTKATINNNNDRRIVRKYVYKSIK